METIGKIRRRHKVRGESISAIARDFNLSRNTVKKYPVGTKFRIRAKLKTRSDGGGESVYSYHGWKYEVSAK